MAKVVRSASCLVSLKIDFVHHRIRQGIGPEHIAQQATFIWLLSPVYFVNLLYVHQFSADTSMNGKVLTVYHRCDGKLVEEVHEMIVGLFIVMLHALVSKVEIGGALARLMVTS